MLILLIGASLADGDSPTKVWSQTPKAVTIFDGLGLKILCCYRISCFLSGAAQAGRSPNNKQKS